MKTKMTSFRSACWAFLLHFLLLHVHSITTTSARRSSSPDFIPDLETLSYLDSIYERAKRLGRPLVEGKMNLLPNIDSAGFADSVECFTDISLATISGDSRTLQFNLSNVPPSREIVAIDLVLKEVPGEHAYQTTLHEIFGEERSDQTLKFLDSGEYTGEWHALHVQDVEDSMDEGSGKRNYQLLLSVSQQGGGQRDGSANEDILFRAKPMLLVYTYEDSLTEMEELEEQQQGEGEGEGPSMTGRQYSASKSSRSRDSRSSNSNASSSSSSSSSDRSPSVRRRRRRSVPVASASDATPSPPSASSSQASSRPAHCSRQVETLSFSDLGWPGIQYSVITPSTATFAFCTGSCNRPLSPPEGINYTNHATLVQFSRTSPRQHHLKPCCVPAHATPISVKYVSQLTKLVYMTTMPHVHSCQCV